MSGAFSDWSSSFLPVAGAAREMQGNQDRGCIGTCRVKLLNLAVTSRPGADITLLLVSVVRKGSTPAAEQAFGAQSLV